MGVLSDDGGASLKNACSALSHPLLFTSSSLGDEMVEGPRRRLFESLVLEERAAALGQFRYHRTQWTARPDISVLMARVDARTVSRTVIDVSSGEASLHYEPLAARDHLGRQAA